MVNLNKEIKKEVVMNLEVMDVSKFEKYPKCYDSIGSLMSVDDFNKLGNLIIVGPKELLIYVLNQIVYRINQRHIKLADTNVVHSEGAKRLIENELDTLYELKRKCEKIAMSEVLK